MTRQPDDPGVDHDREGTRLNQHGDPVMPWDDMAGYDRGYLRGSIHGTAAVVAGSVFGWLIWWLT